MYQDGRQFTDSEIMRTDLGRQFLQEFLINQKQIYQLILALVTNWNDAEDIMQETIVSMWEAW